MKVEDIKKVVIAGAGNMGQQIGTLCSIHGFNVVFYDIEQGVLDRASKRVERLLKRFVDSNKTSREEADESKSRMSFTTDINEAGENADLLSECVPEDPELKGDILACFNSLCPSHTIFTTNSSSLAPSTFADATGRPDKLIALHFHDVRVTDVVDIMPHPGTSEETFRLVFEFAVKLGQVPIALKKESPGYVFNYMLTSLFESAQTLAANGVTSIEDIDRAWMGVTHMKMGPFGLMDSVGIDTVWKVTDYWANELDDEQNKKNAEFLKKYVEKGLLGQKSGKGFYSYPDPAYMRPGFLKGERDKESDNSIRG